jgi:hypothetical protein
MLQLTLHLLGDHVLQSEHMAGRKRTSSIWAGFHAVTYSLPFWLLQPSWAAWSVICGSHFMIDRFGLARYVVWAKNIVFGLWPQRVLGGISKTDQPADDSHRYSWENCRITGYPADIQPWLAGTLIIAADNTIHLIINWASLKWL